jgi:7,8-dihydropterin-6-yl-methyl-4-(beta-D-ribofuranosyl)aminobenzene 5'-phosphate synthase
MIYVKFDGRVPLRHAACALPPGAVKSALNRKDTPMLPIQEVDRLEVQVLVDNAVDPLSSTPRFVTREPAVLRRNGMVRSSGAAMCCANHGLSLVVTAWSGDSPRSVLFDAGPAAMAIAHNAPRLGIDFSAIEAVVLSDGHWDHAGGLIEAFDHIRAANLGRPVPCFLHPGMFAERGARQPDGGVFPMENIASPELLAAHGAAPVVTAEPQALAGGHFYLSGEIPRRTAYERGYPAQVRRGADGRWEPDPLLMDERFMAARVKGRGVVVFSACSHAGIVNVLHEARAAFPGERLHAVMGGFHLSGENEEIIPQTVADLGGFGLDLILPAHCTGWRAVRALAAAYGEGVVVPSAVGKHVTFGGDAP